MGDKGEVTEMDTKSNRENGMKQKRKILLVNTEIKTASTGKITYQFYREMKERGYDVSVASGSECEEKNKDFVCITFRGERTLNRILSEWTGRVCGGAWISTFRLLRLIKQKKPDVIHLLNLHGYYVNEKMLFSYLKKNHYNIVYNMLDEYPYLGSCCYAYECENYTNECQKCIRDKKIYPVSRLFKRGHDSFKKKFKAYGKYNRIVFTGPEWVIKRAEKSSLLERQRLEIVDEFVDTKNIFYPRDIQVIRKNLQIPQDKIIILNVGPLSNPRKGISFFYKMAERIKDERYIFIHVGYNVPHASHPDNVRVVPFIKDQEELAEYYSVADLLICTSIADTMPNVCLDALACGTPVCGFDITGIPFVAKVPYGRFVQTENVDELVKIVMETSMKNAKDIQNCRAYALERYSVQTFADRMEQIYEKYFKQES